MLPKDKTYEELIAILNKHFDVRISVFRQRSLFYSARQYQGEPIRNWFSRLTNISEHCKFGEQLKAIMLDRFISGIQDSIVLSRLYEESEELDLSRAMEIAVKVENSTTAKEKTDTSGEDGFLS